MGDTLRKALLHCGIHYPAHLEKQNTVNLMEKYGSVLVCTLEVSQCLKESIRPSVSWNVKEYGITGKQSESFHYQSKGLNN